MKLSYLFLIILSATLLAFTWAADSDEVVVFTDCRLQTETKCNGNGTCLREGICQCNPYWQGELCQTRSSIPTIEVVPEGDLSSGGLAAIIIVSIFVYPCIVAGSMYGAYRWADDGY
eukprot:CAMPEP_0115022150 /NCGR_PEP_ID=MMETSP0216-20121206/31345_1 /TAXON_ID=223996 /ORGANISM="Protocruzia adherens, Strain Boccale" /LENGTH=116 /DNA_ID=CAMNT_0002394711 /DNA_START=75 /DNA_END=425 /DNA_ORIENTATION=+